MQNKIKNRIEKELKGLVRNLDKAHALSKISPLLSKSIKDFVLRKGKRVRPLFFIVGYLGFAKTEAPGLYKSALSMELLHDFMLVHDDIIDKSATRRGKPAMHKMLGQDLAIVAGDVLYAMAVETFLSIKEDKERKEEALKKFIVAASKTGIGEFIELLSGAKDIGKVTKQDIYRIYDYKTGCYTFASPLSCGAILAGAGQKQVAKLYRYGVYLGRAFQIKDDILGMFGEEKKTGKSTLADLQEAKKTILLWSAYKNSDRKNRLIIKRTLSKDKIKKTDLLKVRRLIYASGAFAYAEKEIARHLKKAQATIKSCRMQTRYKELLQNYSRQLLKLN